MPSTLLRGESGRIKGWKRNCFPLPPPFPTFSTYNEFTLCRAQAAEKSPACRCPEENRRNPTHPFFRSPPATLYNLQMTGWKRPADKRAVSAFGTPVRFLCLKNLADMVEREGDEARALELQVAAADEDGTDLAVRACVACQK